MVSALFEGKEKKGVVIASAYMPADEDIPPKIFTDLVSYCDLNNYELITSMDANAHHQLWGMAASNSRGEELVNYLFTTNLYIANTGSEPTFVTKRSRTIIDLTIASGNILASINNWRVSRESSCSDHRWIRYELQFVTVPPIPTRNPRKTNKTNFKASLKLHLQLDLDYTAVNTITNTEEVEKAVTHLTDSLTKSFENSCPLTVPITHKGKKNYGWNRELDKLREKVRKQFNRAMNTYDDKDWDIYKETQREYKKRIRSNRRKSYKKYCTNIETNHHANRIRKILTSETDRSIGTLKKNEIEYTKNAEETNQLLLETHFPGCLITTGENWEPTNEEAPKDEDWALAKTVITKEKVKWAISSFQQYKAPGLDGIFPGLLQWGDNLIIDTLTPILQSCLAMRYIPLSWREVKVIFIPKPGKSDYTNPKAYRPISLTSFMLKTMERLCDRYIRDNYLSSKPMNPNQHAYSSGKSTESALHKVVHKIEQSLSNKNICLGAFIDIEGAFDRTNFNTIYTALDRHGVHITMIGWVINMLKLRAVRVEMAGKTRGLVSRGCPQGGVLSPLLWNLVANDLITKLNTKRYYTVGYADDMAILIPGHFASVACDMMSNALKIVESWCRENGLTANPNKTELVMFTNKRTLGTYKLPFLFNTQLTLSTEVKYLGVILDNKLNWAKHLETKITKATIAFWQCRRLIGKTWGLQPKITLWLYNTVIKPALTYGAIVWWPRCKLSTSINRLQKFQRTACMASTGCMKTTPTAALEALLGLTPLHLYIRQEAAAAAFRLKALGLWNVDSRASHTLIIEEYATDNPLLVSIYDKVAKQHHFTKHYTIQLQEDIADSSDIHEVRVYTDGSKMEVGTGAGTFSDELNIHLSTHLGRFSSIFQAECVGIIEAAAAVLRRDISNTNIRILSDSAAVLRALMRHDHSSGLIIQCHHALEEVSKHNNNITLQWIKGHSGSRGNDAADELARRGSTQLFAGNEPTIPLPFNLIRSWIREETYKQHKEYWASIKDCRQSKEAFPKLNRGFSRRLLNHKRDKLRLIVGIVTGHCSLNKHLFTVGVTDSPLCRGCLETEETAAHVLLECSSVQHQRRTLLQSPTSVAEACADTGKLLAFLEDIGWLK